MRCVVGCGPSLVHSSVSGTRALLVDDDVCLSGCRVMGGLGPRDAQDRRTGRRTGPWRRFTGRAGDIEDVSAANVLRTCLDTSVALRPVSRVDI